MAELPAELPADEEAIILLRRSRRLNGDAAKDVPVRARVRIRSASEPGAAAAADRDVEPGKRRRRLSSTVEDLKAEVLVVIREVFQNVEIKFLTEFVTNQCHPRLTIGRNIERITHMLLGRDSLPRERKGRNKDAAESIKDASAGPITSGKTGPITSAKTGPITSAGAGAVSDAKSASRDTTKLDPILAPFLGDDYKPDYARSGHLKRPHAINLLASMFFPFAKPSLQRILTYMGHCIAKSVMIIVDALEKFPKLLNVLLSKSTENIDTELLSKVDVFAEVARPAPSSPVRVKLVFLKVWRTSKPPYVARSKAADQLLREANAVDKYLASLTSSSRCAAFKSVSNDDEALFDCECCFSDEIKFAELVQCREGHLFCRDCVKGYVESVVGGIGKVDLRCMHTDDKHGECKADFPISQLQYLDPKLLEQIRVVTLRYAESVRRLSILPPPPHKLLRAWWQ